MIVSNKFVKIDNGKRQITLQNHICNKYLKYINQAQFYENDTQFERARIKRTIYLCYVKLDDIIENLETATSNDFDFQIKYFATDITGNKYGANITYITDSTTGIEVDNQVISINEYAGHTITGLGFCNLYGELLAYLDTSSYGLKIVEDEILRIVRNDEIKSNIEAKGIDFPLHLVPAIYEYTKTAGSLLIEIKNARLYSVGFGTKKGKMNYEYVLDDDEIDIIKTDTTFSFALKTGDKLTLYPHNSLMPSGLKYPLRMYSPQELHPSNNLYSGSNKYPLKSNFKYVILKYQICTKDSNEETIHKTNEFYTMNLESDYIGVFEVKSKIERRT